jgi:hypothetical protein
MSRKLYTIAGVIVGFLSFVAVAAADELPVIAPQLSADQTIQAFREPYINSKFHNELGGNDYLFDWVMQYRCWKRSGFGMDISMRGDLSVLKANEYDYTSIGLLYWAERPSRLLPWTIGWRFAVGALLTGYSMNVSRDKVESVAMGWGAVTNLEFYTIIPICSILFDKPQSRWLPHLEIIVGTSLAWLGKMKNIQDYDLNGDGVIDHYRNQAFRDANGEVDRIALWGMNRMGIVWLF